MKVTRLWFSGERMFIEIDRKEVLSVALWRFPRLKNASDRQRTAWKQFHDGLRWEVIDEDISLESLRWADDDPQTLRWIKI